MTEREKMLAGQLYDCGDKELLTQWHKAKDLTRETNRQILPMHRKKNVWVTENGGKSRVYMESCCKRVTNP